MHFLLPTLVCILALWLILRSPLANRGLDLPNERSLHSHPTPRIGGLGILVASRVPFLLLLLVLLFLVVLVVLGLIDGGAVLASGRA